MGSKNIAPLVGVNSFEIPDAPLLLGPLDDGSELKRIANSAGPTANLETALLQSLALAALKENESGRNSLRIIHALVSYLIRTMQVPGDQETVIPPTAFTEPDRNLSVATGWASAPTKRLSGQDVLRRHLEQARQGYARIATASVQDPLTLRHAFPLAQYTARAAHILSSLRQTAQTTWDADARYLIPGSREA